MMKIKGKAFALWLINLILILTQLIAQPYQIDKWEYGYLGNQSFKSQAIMFRMEHKWR